jgi:peptidoglycan/xylan/chitin deacetylase (PgdA/CDA1 family)
MLLKYFIPLSPSFLLHKYSMKHLKTPSFILSFDDGLRECFDFIAPILEEKRVPAIFFLNNSFIDNKDLFYRYKVSLLIEKVKTGKISKKLIKLITYLLKTDRGNPDNFSKALLNLEYKNIPLIDEIAGLLKLDFSAYLKNHKPYMSTENVKDLISRGFYVGSHTYDHPVIPQLTEPDQEREIIKSMEDIKERFNLDYSFFAFPFSDDGVSDQLFRNLYASKQKPDASFGTSGLRKNPNFPHYQRIPMEKSNGNAKRYLQTEYFYYLLKSVVGRNS